MITKIWYSVQNGGDGSAYPKLMESKELCEFDQENMDEGWGESCYGWFTIESDGPIRIKDEVATIQSEITEIETDLKEGWMSTKCQEEAQYKLTALKELYSSTKNYTI